MRVSTPFNYEPGDRKRVQQSYPLDQSASVVLDGSGNGQCSLGPLLPHEHWQPGSAFVKVTTNTNEASCVLASGTFPTSAQQVAQTSKGSSGATATLSGDLPTGYRIWATWKGGDAGATATLHLTGSRTMGSP
jgi:hypothetical protein